MTHPPEWHELRKTGLGGSEAGALLQPLVEVKYSCRRRLWYEKSGITPDFDREETGPMRLGHLLEPVLCADFAKLTGRRVEEVGRQTHPDYPELGGHVDRMQYDPKRDSPGVLECKGLGTRIFYESKREGLVPEYLLQLQFYLLVTGCSWGSFVVGNRDNLAIMWWDVERNEGICNAILAEGPKFWSTIGQPEHIPSRLEEADRRCRNCEYRLTCWKDTIFPVEYKSDAEKPVAADLEGLAAEYIERKRLLSQAEDLVDETKEQIMEKLGDRTAVSVPVNGELRPLYWRQQEGKAMYKEAFVSLSAQYVAARDWLIKAGEVGAELLPMPMEMVKKGKPSKPLLCQYLEAKPKAGKE